MAKGGIIGMANGGAISAYGVLSHGAQMVMGGEAGPEAFVPLKSGKIPVQVAGSGQQVHNHYEINLSGLVAQPIDEEELLRLIRKAYIMQGAQYG
jgi:hypothetical protein